MHRARCAVVALAVLSLAPAIVTAGEPREVTTVEFPSQAAGRKMKYNVCLPEGYEKSTERYPVLYLLHGLTSNYVAWSKMKVPECAADYPLIVVMPDVGNSWYVNWSEVEDGQPHDWEDFIVKDLIGHVDATYRTVAQREGRAINGLSMGGYGAMMLGLRHPEMFCSIGSHSGALGFARRTAESLDTGKPPAFMVRELSADPNPLIKIDGFNSPLERTPKGRVFTTHEQCDAHDPFKLVLSVDRDKLPHIYVDCGTDDRLIEASQKFAALLIENNIPFTYGQSRGGHIPPYWAREVAQSMAVQYVVLKRNLDALPTKPANSSNAAN